MPRGEALDRIVAVGVFAVGQIELWVGHVVQGPKGVATLYLAVMAACVAVRRRWPLAAGSTALLTNGLMFAGWGNGQSVAVAVAWMCALYGIAVWTDTPGFLAGLGALVFANFVSSLHPAPQIDHSTVLFTVIPAIAMFLIRRAVRDRQLRAETLAAHAELLEREHELRAHEAVAEERARIARELHDLVAHNVSVMVVQAGAERHALPDDQASTREALTSIEQAGRQALAEARRLLGVLRRNGEHEELEPQPSLEHIDVLVDQVQRAGLPVKLEIEGEPLPLPAGLDLCGYRIVQEGLTNALKHAGPAHAEVVLRYRPQALEVEVRDDGQGAAEPAADGAGHGLIGMRERVALYGGSLAIGPREGGGFEVRARLPLS
ncbi:MAG: sensor histidine kinase [Thermoleophilaceae bacterium]